MASEGVVLASFVTSLKVMVDLKSAFSALLFSCSAAKPVSLAVSPRIPDSEIGKRKYAKNFERKNFESKFPKFPKKKLTKKQKLGSRA